MRTLVALATIVAAAIGLLLWQLFASEPRPTPAPAAPAERASAADPADAGPPPQRQPPPQAQVAEREPPEPGAPVSRPPPNFAGAEPEPAEPEPEQDELADIAPERVSRCKRAIAHTFEIWARETAQGDPEKMREAMAAGRPRALQKCARGEVTLQQMDCVLAATSTADITNCGIGGSSADAPDELDESSL